MFGSGVPAAGGPGGADEASDDEGVGQGDEGVDDALSSFGADLQLPEAAGVPGVGALHDPAGACLEGEPLPRERWKAHLQPESLTLRNLIGADTRVHGFTNDA